MYSLRSDRSNVFHSLRILLHSLEDVVAGAVVAVDIGSQQYLFVSSHCAFLFVTNPSNLPFVINTAQSPALSLFDGPLPCQSTAFLS